MIEYNIKFINHTVVSIKLTSINLDDGHKKQRYIPMPTSDRTKCMEYGRNEMKMEKSFNIALEELCFKHGKDFNKVFQNNG